MAKLRGRVSVLVQKWATISGTLLGLTVMLASCGGSSSGGGTPAPTVTLSASPTPIANANGQFSTLTFASTNATMGTIDNGVGPSGANGSVRVSPTQTTTYTITVTGPGGSAMASAKVTVDPAPTVNISANPMSIPLLGDPTTLTVTATNATQVVITDSQDFQSYTLTATGGSQAVTPRGPTTYTATATGVNASTATAPVTITVPPTIPTLTSLTSFTGMAQKPGASDDVDPNGAIGTKQFMEYVNVFYQAYDKKTGTPVLPFGGTPADQAATNPWKQANPPLTDCVTISLDMVILFDRLALRWVIAGHTPQAPQGPFVPYVYCIAVSNTDDLASPTLSWHAYEFQLDSILGTNSAGTVYQPDWPRLGTWPDAYYTTFDLIDPSTQFEVGIVACALDRTSMLAGSSTPNLPQCFKETSPLSNGVYLGHSLIPADVDGTTPPPAGRDDFMVSIENPPNDGTTTTANSFNLWDFHVDWTDPANSTFTQSSISEAPYTPGCYLPKTAAQTICVFEPGVLINGVPTGEHIDSVGDRFMPRYAYRNFLSTYGYESFLVSHTVQTGPGVNDTPNGQQTGIRWYELRSGGSGTPSLYQDGTISPDTSLFRFLPSIAQDSAGNAAVGYSVSDSLTDPGINVATWNLLDPGPPVETPLITGNAEEITANTGNGKWGSYSSMTVDPMDDCTFWYVNEYFVPATPPATPTWQTQISSFKLSGC